MRRALLAVAGLLPVLLQPAPGAAADLQRLESVGVVPVDAASPGRRPPRDDAVAAAVARAVEKVAVHVLPEGWEAAAGEGDEPKPKAGAPSEIEPLLATALGSDPFEYATRFRILEDRGARNAIFTRDTPAEQEYVVVVEVFVDAGRVRERLGSAGWIETPAGDGPISHVRLVLEDLGSFQAYDALRRTLLDDLRVRSALPLELTKGRAVLAVEGPYGAESLLEALMRSSREGLRVVPLERNGNTLTLLVDWEPPPAPARSAPGNGSGASGTPPEADSD